MSGTVASAMYSPTSSLGPESSPPRIEWTNHAARRRPGQAALAGCVCLAAGVSAGAEFGSAAISAIVALGLVVSLRRFFFPVRYLLNQTGAATRCLGMTRSLPWRRVRRFRYDEVGAFLSTRAQRNLLDAFLGLHLTWAENQHEVVRLIERYLAASQEH